MNVNMLAYWLVPQSESEVKSLSRVWFFATPWTVAHQASPSMGFSRQEYWSGLPVPSPGDLPNPGIKPRSPALQAGILTSEPPGKKFLQLILSGRHGMSLPRSCFRLSKKERRQKVSHSVCWCRSSIFNEALKPAVPAKACDHRIVAKMVWSWYVLLWKPLSDGLVSCVWQR